MENQLVFFDLIKQKLQPGVNLADYLKEHLFLSKDSAYRRLRGETSLSFEEIIKLAKDFNISLDNFVGSNNKDAEVIFHLQRFRFNPTRYLTWIEKEFTIPSFDYDFEMLYSAKGLPVYYNFIFPEIAVFKAYYYNKVLLNNKDFDGVVFDFQMAYDLFLGNQQEVQQLKDKIYLKYLNTPSTEIWNIHTFDGHLQQIRYSWETGLFKDKENALLLMDKTQEMLNNTKAQAEKGLKINPEYPDDTYGAFNMYFSELVHLEHTFWRKIDEQQSTFIIHNIGDFIFTYNEVFCKRTMYYLKNLMEKATNISKQSPKARHRLFKTIEKKVMALRMEIEEG